MTSRRAQLIAVFVVATLALSGCGRGITLTITNDCDHPIDAQIFTYHQPPGERGGSDLIEYGQVENYAVGQTREKFYHIGPFADLYAEIITNRNGAAQAAHFGDAHDLPNDYIISGGMCLNWSEPEDSPLQPNVT